MPELALKKPKRRSAVQILHLNTRTRILISIIIAALYIGIVFIWGVSMGPSNYAIDYGAKLQAPSASHIFGTDYMGRDMLARSVKGMSTSLVIGLVAAVISSIIGLLLGIASAVIGGKFDKVVLWLVDLCMGLPHLVLLILISVMLGKGMKGVMIGVALTHWPELTRIIRAEVMQVRSSQFVQAAYRMGESRFTVARRHIIPHVIPVYLVGLLLLFPHAIMHEASITFLGFGLPPDSPAIGVILSESMRYIASGKWWLALFPGILLLLTVIFFQIIGDDLKELLNPTTGNL